MKDIDDKERLSILEKAIEEEKIERIFREFDKNKINCILIKGWAIWRFYPFAATRLSLDVDICVDHSDFEKAEILKEQFARQRISIDLHKGARHLDQFPFERLFANSVEVELKQTKIRVLCEEDHLRVVCVHWLNDGGEKFERLRDIYYLVENRSSDFDWDKCLNTVSEIRRQWVISTIALAHRYLKLNVDDLPIADEIKNPKSLPEWLIKSVEREWNNPTPLISLNLCLNDWQKLLRQIKKRIPPNPIQASIETEAPFDDSWRLPYQIKDILQRIKPSIMRIKSEFK